MADSKSKAAKKVGKAIKRSTAEIDQSWVRKKLIRCRDETVIADSDLAEFFDTTTSAINQYRSRNADRFEPDYAFQLSLGEWRALQAEDPLGGWGGRKSPAWVYTEHGVVMMSMGMQSEHADALARVIIDTFVQFRRGTLPRERVLTGPDAEKKRRELLSGIYSRITEIMNRPLMPDGSSLNDELGEVGTGAMKALKSMLAKPGKTNEKITAEIGKILAETEKVYQEASKTQQETRALAIQNMRDEIALIRELREMAGQLERDDWADRLDAFSSEASDGEIIDLSPDNRLENSNK